MSQPYVWWNANILAGNYKQCSLMRRFSFSDVLNLVYVIVAYAEYLVAEFNLTFNK